MPGFSLMLAPSMTEKSVALVGGVSRDTGASRRFWVYTKENVRCPGSLEDSCPEHDGGGLYLGASAYKTKDTAVHGGFLHDKIAHARVYGRLPPHKMTHALLFESFLTHKMLHARLYEGSSPDKMLCARLHRSFCFDKIRYTRLRGPFCMNCW
jgi:hypothetical protein